MGNGTSSYVSKVDHASRVVFHTNQLGPSYDVSEIIGTIPFISDPSAKEVTEAHLKELDKLDEQRKHLYRDD